MIVTAWERKKDLNHALLLDQLRAVDARAGFKANYVADGWLVALVLPEDADVAACLGVLRDHDGLQETLNQVRARGRMTRLLQARETLKNIDPADVPADQLAAVLGWLIDEVWYLSSRR